jgi:hypothetical protein
MRKELICPHCQQPITADIKVKTKTKRSLSGLVDMHKTILEDIIINLKKETGVAD